MTTQIVVQPFAYDNAHNLVPKNPIPAVSRRDALLKAQRAAEYADGVIAFEVEWDEATDITSMPTVFHRAGELPNLAAVGLA